MTKYYFYTTEDYHGVLATDGRQCSDNPVKNGIDITSGIDLYAEDAEEKLIEAYCKLAEECRLYDFMQIAIDFADDIFDFDPTDYKKLTLLARV